jgi:hypothetical protein
MTMASGVAITATTVAWASRHSVAPQEAQQEDTVRVFMALGGSSQKAPVAAGHSESPSPECVPCRQKGLEPIAGRVPSRPPPHPIDQDYERITGRSHLFMLPAEKGHALHVVEPFQCGWMMILSGLPIKQINCFVEVKGDRVSLSRFSGAMQSTQVDYGLTDATPNTDPDVALLVNSVKTFVRLAASASDGWSSNIAYDGFIAASVASQNVYLIPTGSTWSRAYQEDIHVRLQPTGRIVQMEYVRARGEGSYLVASRVVLFPEYGVR